MQIPITQLPNVTPLAADYIQAYEKAAEFYNGDFREMEIYQSRADAVKSRKLPLEATVPILNEQNRKFGCGFQTFENIDKLLTERACAIVTGQQTGLFSGPLYTIYKILTTIKLTAQLNQNCKTCFVPIFWLTSDDHDFREVNHIKIINQNNQVEEISYDVQSIDAKIPVSKIFLKPEINEVVQRLANLTFPSEYKDQVLKLLSNAYQPDHNFASAFGNFLMQLFKSYGLILIDASDPRLKEFGKHIFQKEIDERSPSSKQVMRVAELLLQRGYHNQVQLHDGFLNLFLIEGQRCSIEFSDDSFTIKDLKRKYQIDALLKLLENRPHQFSPNVILRPIYQDALLPTVAYVAGPAEIAYYAQMKGVYDSFHIPMPIIYPRKGMTLVETKIQKVLTNYQLEVQDFWGDVELLINRIVKDNLPHTLEEQLNRVASNLQTDLRSLEAEISSFEPTLKDTVKVVKGKILHQLDGLEKKILQAYKKRNEMLRQQVYKAYHNIYPNNNFQERELNITPYLFKYGIEFIDRLYEAIDISNYDHQILKL